MTEVPKREKIGLGTLVPWSSFVCDEEGCFRSIKKKEGNLKANLVRAASAFGGVQGEAGGAGAEAELSLTAGLRGAAAALAVEAVAARAGRAAAVESVREGPRHRARQGQRSSRGADFSHRHDVRLEGARRRQHESQESAQHQHRRQHRLEHPLIDLESE